MNRIKIFDTTLRDGEQAPGCSMNLEEKLEVARQLERLGVDVIEAGFPICSPGDFQSVQAIAGILKNCTVAGLARALQKDIDAVYESVKKAASPRIHLFLSTSPLHMEYKLRMKPEQVLEQAAAMTAYAKTLCADVEFSAEDAMRSDPAFLKQIVQAVISAGATTVNIPDTVGFVLPEEMFSAIQALMNDVPNIHKAELSVHCHNDLGMGVANSLAGVRAGAVQIECTVNGLGERAGNASLEEIVMALRTRPGLFAGACKIDTTQLYRTSRLVYNIIGQPVPINKPIVGGNAFAHEAGIHQHGVMANRATYEIMTPESIGLPKNQMVLGKHSGKHAFAERLQELGYELSPEEVAAYFEQFKELCDRKKTINDADLEAIVHNRAREEGAYRLLRFDVHSKNHAAASCQIALEKEGVTLEEVSLGSGPVDAAYNAIDKLTGLSGTLKDYFIHSVSDGQDALGEVVVKLQREGGSTVTGRGLSPDIIEASILAYINGVNKLLQEQPAGNCELHL